MKFDSGSLWYLENENPSTTESWTDENFDLKNPRYERRKKIHNFALRPFCQIRAALFTLTLKDVHCKPANQNEQTMHIQLVKGQFYP